MNILIQTRLNFFEFDGGDKIQILSTKKELEKLGHKVDVSSKFVKEINKYDVIHLFNIQINPDLLMIYLLHAHSKHKPVALSTIYWNPKQWKQSDDLSSRKHNNTAQNSMSIMKSAGISIKLQIYYLLISKEFRRRWLLGLKGDKQKTAQYIKEYLIQNADIILPNGRAEEKMVRKDFGSFQKSIVIPNGVDDLFAKASPSAFIKKYGMKNFVLSVGRIESRKNTTALARACEKLKLKLVLIGNTTREKKYVNKVKEAGGKYLTIIPEMEHEFLGSAYRAAKVHALVSWFETPGLSNLEAATARCNIVSTSVGPTKEYFGKHAWYCQPDNLTSIENALSSAYKASKNSDLSNIVLSKYSWGQVAAQTALAYNKIVEKV